jgi:SAM-dependent methyltransferase
MIGEVDSASNSHPALKVFYARAIDGIDTDDICHDQDNVTGSLEINGFSLVNPYKTSAISSEDIIERNSHLLKQSDVLLANLSREDYNYVGAIYEIVEAALWHLPIVVYLGQSQLLQRKYLHRYSAFLCDSLDDALLYLSRCCSVDGMQVQVREEIAYYNHIARDYEENIRRAHELAATDPELYRRERTCLRDMLRRYCRGKDVLELGCGDGDWTQYIVEVANSVVCVDSSRNMIRQARKRFRQASHVPHFIHANIFHDDHSVSSCDVVVCYFLLALLPPLLQRKVLAIMREWVNVSGYCLFAEPNMEPQAMTTIGYGRRRFEIRTVESREFIIYKERFASLDLRRLTEACGLEIVYSSEATRYFSFCAARRVE